MEIRKYTEEYRLAWERLVDLSINGTFLIKRKFMDYHGGRFLDYSLVAYADGILLAVFPAESDGKQVFSHRGLSYGGWVFAQGISKRTIIDVVKLGLDFLGRAGFESLYIRSIPGFYHEGNFDLIQEVYQRFGSLTTKKTFQTIASPFAWKSKGRRWGLKKAIRSGLTISDDSRLLDEFWQKVLGPNLWQRHQVMPAHSLEEIRLLMQRFPEQIRLFCTVKEGEILAGVLVFCMDRVVHTQYIANSPRGRELMALDVLMHHLMFRVYPGIQFLSLGISNEPSTGLINRGLYEWKASLGALDFEVSDYMFQLQSASA
jgi:hypothetical protein